MEIKADMKSVDVLLRAALQRMHHQRPPDPRGVLLLPRERIFVEFTTSDYKLKAFREGSK